MIVCDKCRTKHPPQKITKHKNEYLCDDCLGERLADKYTGSNRIERVGLTKGLNFKPHGIFQFLKALFKR